MTDLTPEKLAEIRTLATNTRDRTVLLLLDALDAKERDCAVDKNESPATLAQALVRISNQRFRNTNLVAVNHELHLELAAARPSATYREGQEDGDYYCDSCGSSVLDERGHSHAECVAHLKAVDDSVTGYLGDENARLIAELAAAKAASRLTKVDAAAITDAIRYPDNGALHCRWCSAGSQEAHESRCWYLEQVKRADAARALVDRLSAAALCLGCRKPFSSPDHDQRCSSCAESGTGPEPADQPQNRASALSTAEREVVEADLPVSQGQER